MCFSAQASFTASAVLLFISALCFKKAQNNSQRLLASGPSFFAVQQALEGIVWLTLNRGDMHSMLQSFSAYGFLSFAYIFWPIYIPLTVYVLEKNSLKKKISMGLLGLGSLIAVTGLLSLILFTYTPNALHHHIAYEYIPAFNTVWSPTLMVLVQNILLALYTIVIVGSLLISTTPYLWLSGSLIGLGFIVAQLRYAVAFGSVWCFFGALASIVIYFSLCSMHTERY